MQCQGELGFELPLIKAPGIGKGCLLQQHDILFDRLIYKIHLKKEARR